MLNTTNYKLKKPEPSNAVDINDFNYNADVIDKKIKELNDEKISKIEGKQLSTEDYTTVEKQKLAGIEKGANKYIHPNNSSTRHVSDSEKSKWNNAVSKSGDTMTGDLLIRNLLKVHALGDSTYLQFLDAENEKGLAGFVGGSNNLLLKNTTTDGYISLSTKSKSDYALLFNNAKVWHQGNDGHGSDLDADKLDGFESEQFTREIKVSKTAKDSTKYVIPLCKMNKDSGSLFSLSSGVLTFSRTNGLYEPKVVEVVFQNTYRQDKAYFSILRKGYTQEIIPCTFIYNGIKFAGIQYYAQIAATGVTIFEGNTTLNDDEMTLIPYYDTKNGVVVNTEINDSLYLYDETNSDNPLQRKSTFKFNEKDIYHAGNSYPVIEKGNNANGYYIRFADGTQICYHTFFEIINVLTSTGNIYVSDEKTWTYPSAFLGNTHPNMFGSVSNVYSPWLCVNRSYDTTIGLFKVGCGEELTSKDTRYSLVAIGRWK